MGALARLLGRRTADGEAGGSTATATLPPKRARSPKDLLHASGLTCRRCGPLGSPSPGC